MGNLDFLPLKNAFVLRIEMSKIGRCKFLQELLGNILVVTSENKGEREKRKRNCPEMPTKFHCF